MKKSSLSAVELKRIRQLIDEGKSLNQISNKLNRPKTTRYYHFRKIKGRTVFPIQVNTSNDEKVGEFMGLFAGDGCFYFVPKSFLYRIYLCFNVFEWHFVDGLIEKVLIPLFGKRPMIFISD